MSRLNLNNCFKLNIILTVICIDSGCTKSAQSSVKANQSTEVSSSAQKSYSPNDDFVQEMLAYDYMREDVYTDCHFLSLVTLMRMPNALAWAESKKLVEKSAVTSRPTYSKKIETKDFGEPQIVMGCWVTTGEPLKEIIGGQEKAYMKAKYRINPLIKDSPLMALEVCKQSKDKPYILNNNEFIVVTPDSESCKTDYYKRIILKSFADMEKEPEVLIPLRVLGASSKFEGKLERDFKSF